MAKPQVRLAFGGMLGRVTFGLFLLIEVSLAIQVFRRARGRFGVAFILFNTPSAFVMALLIAAILTVAADLFVRFLLQPMVDAWHQPRVDPHHGSFHLEPREVLIETIPARRKVGLVWRTGTLALTDRRIWFFPESWDAEPWSNRHLNRGWLSLQPSPAWLGGLVKGLPDRLVIGDEPGDKATFGLLEAESLAMKLRRLEPLTRSA